MSPAAKKVRVLFVEDAFDQALLVKSALPPDAGFEVTHCQDGDAALALLAERDWDLVIADLNLPGSDGFAVIRAARAKAATMPILATTGYTAMSYQEEALRAGADEVMLKPLDRVEFQAQVRSLTRSPSNEPAASDRAHVRTILALGGLAGDVEIGCGATLSEAAANGARVVIIPLCKDEFDPGDAAIAQSRIAAKALGLHLVVDMAGLSETDRRVGLVEKAIAELRPGAVYLPAMDDSHPARMEAFRIGMAATQDVPSVFGYQTATTGTGFSPTVFADISARMDAKTAALDSFTARIDLTREMAMVYARYWGRFQRFGLVEAFEVTKGSG